nr:MAG TPA: hypothetical protein [Caudoviricetes sp.]
MAREYFCAYHSYIKQCKGLSDGELGRLFRALLEYSASGKVPELNGRESVAFDFMSANIDRDAESYKDTCNRNRENISKRYERIRANTTIYETYQEKEEEKEKEELLKKDISNEISKKSTRQKKFVPPTVEEVAAYCLERKNKVDAAYFVDHYTSNGWKVGKQNMKDWKAAVRTWEKNGYNQPSKKQDAAEPNGYSFDLEEYERSHKYTVPELAEEK